MIFLLSASVRREIRLGPALTWGSPNRTDNEHELQDLVSLHAPPTPPPRHLPTASDKAAHSLGCFRGNSDHHDGHTVYNPAPHLGYELAYQGLSTLVMGPMTMPHLGSRPCGLRGPQSTDSGSKREAGGRVENKRSYLNKVMDSETLGL